MSVLMQIAAWAKKLPAWQSDAVRRLLSTDSLTKEDGIELYDILKAQHGLSDPKKKSPEPKPVGASFQPPEESASKVSLKKLHELKNVNALATGHCLVFEPRGVTAIYGGNGAGKSGYSRVLKRACHAREKKETIHPNVLTSTSGKPEATFELDVDGTAVSFKWVSGQSSSEHLAQVAVFDSHCARVFLDDANEVVYLPYGLDIFGKLAALCKSFKDKLQAEVDSLDPYPQILTEFSPESRIGKLLAGLKRNTSIEPFEALAALNATEQQHLAKLEALVADAKANSPRAKAERLRRLKRRIEALCAAILVIENGLLEPAITALQIALDESTVAARAVSLASTQAFNHERLSGVGGGPWKLMYDAAMRYSVEEAYPGREFPVTDGDSRCVLCQQVLSHEASQRFQRFKTFVEQATAKRNTSAAQNFQSKLTAINSINVAPHFVDAELMAEIRELSPQCAGLIEDYVAAAQARLTAIQNAVKDGKWTDVPKLASCPDSDLLKLENDLEAQAVLCDGMAEPEGQAKREAELEDLKAREKLGKHLDAIKKHLARLEHEYCLKKCIDQTGTANITKSGSKIMEEAVTGTLEKAVRDELKFFGLERIPLKLKKSGDYGLTRHRLQFENCTAKADLSEILSEGEQRIVAIASFLAEIKTHKHHGPIVFDDPVSSLDHLFRERVAERLITEGRSRQVIVFTHDIVMLLAIERAAALQQVKLHIQTVRRDVNGPGACEPSIPWVGMAVKSRLSYVRNKLNEARPLHKTGDDGYTLLAAKCYGLLRETWERAIEEVLLNDTIQRFRPSIETVRLKQVAVETGDYVVIDNAMAKCSTYMEGHDSAAAINSAMPPPADIEADINVLADFQKTVTARREAARKQAEVLLSAPASSA